MQRFRFRLSKPVPISSLIETWERKKEQFAPRIDFLIEDDWFVATIRSQKPFANFRQSVEMAVRLVDPTSVVTWED
jgi:hypothetical protein